MINEIPNSEHRKRRRKIIHLPDAWIHMDYFEALLKNTTYMPNSNGYLIIKKLNSERKLIIS